MSIGNKDVYAKRLLNSVTVPLEPDYDSDFNPGPYISPEMRKRKRRDVAKPRKRRKPSVSVDPEEAMLKGLFSDVDDDNERGSQSVQRETRIVHPDAPPNPLKEFFGQFAEEPEPDDGAELDNVSGGGEEEEEDEDEDEEEEGGSSPMSEEEKCNPEERRSKKSPLRPQLKPPIHHTGSTTEEEPPSIDVVAALGKSGHTGSTTEEDDFQALWTASTPNPSTSSISEQPGRYLKTTDTSIAQTGDDSATEEEEEDEIIGVLNPKNKPRPGFPLAPGQQVLRSFVLDTDTGVKIPASLNTYLRPYQRDGVQFFYDRYKKNRGGILGDDMGLGKTIQVISFLSAIMQKTGYKRDAYRRARMVSELQDRSEYKEQRRLPPADATYATCLIIAPRTLIENWQRELAKWGYFEVGVYAGKERDRVLQDFKMGRLDVVIMSYEMARKDIDLIDDLRWSCVFADEVHRLKGKSSTTSALHHLKCLRRFGLSGTVIQNSYSEMWGILDWAVPGFVGTKKQWQHYVVTPLTIGQSAKSTLEQQAKLQQVALTLRDEFYPHFFLRRTKDLLKGQLPCKYDEVVFCPLSPVQKQIYKRIVNLDVVVSLYDKKSPCTCGSNQPREKCCYPFKAAEVFRYISVLLKLSNHLALILPAPTETGEQLERNRELSRRLFPNGAPRYGEAVMNIDYCGKWVVLQRLLDEWKKDHSNKVLIFTKSVKLLEMLEFALKTQAYKFVRLDGSVPQEHRMDIIDEFTYNPEVFIFLISTLAGGTGLNLVAANKVVIFDPNWNPAYDLQAMDRAFRFGQTRDVYVYRLLGSGSLEELIYARQVYKQQQMKIGYDASIQTRYFEGVQGDKSKQGELFGIKNIFSLQEDESKTKLAIERANIAELNWALANVKTANPLVNNKDEGELQGLGSLLFNDDAKLALDEEQERHRQFFSHIGIKYTHQNENLLISSKVEEARTNAVLMKSRAARRRKTSPRSKSSQNTKTAAAQVNPPPAQWPPKRRHHKPKPAVPTAEEQLRSRYAALLAMGQIDDIDGLSAFAEKFKQFSPEDRQSMLDALDSYVVPT